MIPYSSGLSDKNLSFQNGEKSRILASALFPGEEWVLKALNIWVEKNRSGKGYFICYFEHIGKLYTWSYDELRAIIGKR
ncbi:MAG: hypothetical protein LBG07_00275 [Treponema sp.]|jgi:hypothetical protein|nr:hypothetical protein [Treponema sp.]